MVPFNISKSPSNKLSAAAVAFAACDQVLEILREPGRQNSVENTVSSGFF
jgi:hypothetical protein